MKNYLKVLVFILFVGASLCSCNTSDEFEEITIEEVSFEADEGNGSETGGGVGSNPPPPAD